MAYTIHDKITFQSNDLDTIKWCLGELGFESDVNEIYQLVKPLAKLLVLKGEYEVTLDLEKLSISKNEINRVFMLQSLDLQFELEDFFGSIIYC